VKVAGYTVGSVVRIGIAAVVFIIVLKFAAHKSGIPAAQRVAEMV